VLQLSALGFTSREIGEKLIISPKTADTYRQRAMEKLGLAHRSDLIQFALRAGILDDYRE
jgi:two-component system, NarL family, response regulator NreC